MDLPPHIQRVIDKYEATADAETALTEVQSLYQRLGQRFLEADHERELSIVAAHKASVKTGRIMQLTGLTRRQVTYIIEKYQRIERSNKIQEWVNNPIGPALDESVGDDLREA